MSLKSSPDNFQFADQVKTRVCDQQRWREFLATSAQDGQQSVAIPRAVLVDWVAKALEVRSFQVPYSALQKACSDLSETTNTVKVEISYSDSLYVQLSNEELGVFRRGLPLGPEGKRFVPFAQGYLTETALSRAQPWLDFQREFALFSDRHERSGARDNQDSVRVHDSGNDLDWAFVNVKGSEILDEYKAMFARAGHALGCPTSMLAMSYWLQSLREYLISRESDYLYPPASHSGMIVWPAKASAAYCAWLWREASLLADRESTPSIEQILLEFADILWNTEANNLPLGDNPFPPEHEGFGAFTRASLEAKMKFAALRSDYFKANPRNSSELLNCILEFQKRSFKICAKGLLSIVGNEETAREYEQRLSLEGQLTVERIMAALRVEAPAGVLKLPPADESEILAEIVQIAEFYKAQAWARALEAHEQYLKVQNVQSLAKDGIDEPTQKEARETTRSIRCVGEFWEICFENKLIHVRTSKGLSYISKLLECPDRSFACLELSGAIQHPDQVPAEHAGAEVLDPKAIKEYKAEAKALKDKIAQARACGDEERLRSLTLELQTIERELVASTRLGHRSRTFVTAAERSRKAVCGAIRSEMARIDKQNRSLAAHLRKRIHLGNSVKYTSDSICWQND